MEVGRQLQLAILDSLVSLAENASGLKIFAEVLVCIYRVFRHILVVPVEQLEYVSEYLGAVASIDFLDNEVNIIARKFPRFDLCVGECLRNELVSQNCAHFDRLICTDKRRIVTVRVEGRAEGILIVAFYYAFYLI